ncbi:hypothetical protein GGP77_002237 [Salinibacter ruber]|jgi:hypothetical protein|uniref:hypothetical protein n=1 Tax=Salinibacter ruber TaxID=146919 RepID=UPI00216A564D|nr:hypothetical protein [Salinibacter ruber]MCS3639667.1 hypothetical protein [Salinibacter ruber]MCS3667994.1 hypothetical protein [Salinibacter ruber]
MPRCLALPLSLAGLCLVLLLSGCGDASDLGVAAGRYRLQIQGAVTDTLAGPAVLRSARDARVGLELGTRDGPGLSMAFTPRGTGGAPDAATGRYDVVRAALLNAPRTDSLPGLVAFLSLPDARFEATEGHVSITRAGRGAVGGTFTLEMTEQAPALPTSRTIQVTGTLRARRP